MLSVNEADITIRIHGTVLFHYIINFKLSKKTPDTHLIESRFSSRNEFYTSEMPVCNTVCGINEKSHLCTTEIIFHQQLVMAAVMVKGSIGMTTILINTQLPLNPKTRNSITLWTKSKKNL
jgi:hypothetical protein